MFRVTLHDPDGVAQRVSKNGEAAVSGLDYSEPYYVQLTVDDQIYNVVPGKPGKKFVMNGVLIATDRNIVGEKAVHVYEATSTTDSVHAVDIITLDMVKSERVYFPLVNVATENGAYINAHSEDSTVTITVFGHYVNA